MSIPAALLSQLVIVERTQETRIITNFIGKTQGESDMGTGVNAQTQGVDLTKKNEADCTLYTRLNEG